MPPSKYQKILKENGKLLENRNWDRAPLILAENKKHIESVQNSILFLHFLLNRRNCQIQLPPRFVKQISKWADITGGSKRLHNSDRRWRCEEEWRRVNWKNNIRERKHTINERNRLCGSRIEHYKCKVFAFVWIWMLAKSNQIAENWPLLQVSREIFAFYGPKSHTKYVLCT